MSVSNSDKVNLTTKIAGEQLALSRQWEQIGYALLATLMAILGALVANRSMFNDLPTPWAIASWGSVVLFATSMAVLSARYILLSVLYFHIGMTRLNVAQAALNEDPKHVVADLLKDQYGTPEQLNMSHAVYRWVHRINGVAFMCAPLVLIGTASVIIAAGQMTKATPRPASLVSPVAIRTALEAAGVEFTNGDAPGVKLRKVEG